MVESVRTFLMFQGEAEAAMEAYVALFGGDAVVSDVERWGAGAPGKEGMFQRARLRLKDLEVIVFDSPAKHAFAFTPAISLFVECGSEAEIDRLAGGLLEGGTALMPLGAYGFSRTFAWVNDRFGVSWQLNLA
jgi:predicted 3-demethylubiquinone-9 3-methyltransferase (glyoxalase superfamily)